MLLGSPVLKKKSALRRFSAPVRVVIDSPPALSTRAATRQMVYNIEPDPNDDVEDMEMSLGSSKTRRSLNYEVDMVVDSVCEKGVREEHEEIADEERVGAEFEEGAAAQCEEVAEIELDNLLENLLDYKKQLMRQIKLRLKKYLKM
ncbi:uncharacterized protein LOC133828956 [Humulus lupulus]|uniref:uncharacterized protein LOC133828956 n=1 Tax=Humulus lupulus TaxID=3486 RepID=UPI002B40548E|nr:uncharacterized protein LOC133828956 [Humulus lupulus]